MPNPKYANRSQTYGTDRNLSKQNGVLICISTNSITRLALERRENIRKKHVPCSLENQRIVTSVTLLVNTRVQIARFVRIAGSITNHVRFQLTKVL